VPALDRITQDRAGTRKLSQDFDPNLDRATISEADPNWVAPTSYVGVAKRQEAMTIRRRSYYLYANYILPTRIACCAFGTGTYDVPATHRGAICPLARLLRQLQMPVPRTIPSLGGREIASLRSQ
jgi:hypothetical protein